MAWADHIVERLAKVSSAIMSDILDEAGLPNQVLSSAFRPLNRLSRVAGPALCARSERIVRRPSVWKAISSYELERRMRPGMVAVIDADSSAFGALVGGFSAATLLARGCKGLLLNGAIRDALEVEGLGLPVFSVATTPMRGTGRRELVDIDAPVFLPGADGNRVRIGPGDFIVGDFDGVVVLPSPHADALVAAAEKLVKVEAEIEREIAGGATREEALARHPRFSHVEPIAERIGPYRRRKEDAKDDY